MLNRSDYERLLYALTDRYPEVTASTLRLYDNSAASSLASSFPHHYHTAPDIKHHRLPAPGMAFDTPNLPVLINDCIELGKTLTP